MNVLIVDDQEPMRELLSRWLTPLGYEIFQAPSADAAVLILENHPMAVVLCDRSMPGHDGDWLVGQVRERFPAVGVILATADDSVPPRISLQNGVLGYLVKPFNRTLVVNAVADAVAWHAVAARSGTVRVTAANPVDAWLHGRAGRTSEENK